MENKKRYNEKETIKRFHVSELGITFLVDHAKGNRRYDIRLDKNTMDGQVNNIIDYYFAWISNFPVRRSMRISRYEFLKYLEDFCSNNNSLNLFDFLFV